MGPLKSCHMCTKRWQLSPTFTKRWRLSHMFIMSQSSALLLLVLSGPLLLLLPLSSLLLLSSNSNLSSSSLLLSSLPSHNLLPSSLLHQPQLGMLTELGPGGALTTLARAFLAGRSFN